MKLRVNKPEYCDRTTLEHKPMRELGDVLWDIMEDIRAIAASLDNHKTGSRPPRKTGWPTREDPIS